LIYDVANQIPEPVLNQAAVAIATMASVGSIAQSGMAAATLHLQVAANNIANASSSGPTPGSRSAAGFPNAQDFPNAYVAQRVTQSEAPGGGVNASVTAASPGAVAQVDPTAAYADAHGMVMSPNVDFVGEIAGAMMAKANFAANAAVMRTYSKMQQSLLDVTA
jgi:flagellar basal-body rod protein FlgC